MTTGVIILDVFIGLALADVAFEIIKKLIKRRKRTTVAEELAMLKDVITAIESRHCESYQERDCGYCRSETDSTERITDE